MRKTLEVGHETSNTYLESGNSKQISENKMKGKRVVDCLLITVLLIALDQITKTLLFGRDFFISFIHIHPVKNFGLPFGLNFGSSINLIILIVAFVVILFYFKQKPGLVYLIFAGALSNLLDRMMFGYVRDFLDLHLAFTFNIADILIIFGLILIFWQERTAQKYLRKQAKL